MKNKLPETFLKTLKYATNHSPFYKNLFKENKINVKEIKTRQDLNKIPLTKKSDLTDSKNNFISKNIDIVEWVTTSGTSSSPIKIPLTINDLKRLEYNEFMALSSAGIKKNDTVLIAVAMDRLFIAGLAYYMGLQKIGAKSLRCGSNSSDLIIESLCNFKPGYLIGVPSYLAKVAKDAIERGIALKNFKIKGIIAIGEPVGTLNYKRNNIGNYLEELWHTKVFSTYASTEMSASFCECPHQLGGHYPDDLVFIEILNGNNEPVMEGEAGEVIVTPLGIEGFPLIRYATGDIAVFDSKPCKCGYKQGRLSAILGRKSQMLKIKGTTVFLSSILDALASIKEIDNYFVTVKRLDNLIDSVEVKVSLNEKSKINIVESKLKGILKVTVDIIEDSKKNIEARQKHISSKKRFYEDLR